MIRRTESSLGIVVSAQGEARRPEPALFDAAQRQAVRYADPASWTIAAAAARAVAEAGQELIAARTDVAVIAVSDDGPKEAMAAIAEASRAGYSSPLRYPAANPGSLAGVVAILFGFQGPTLNLAAPPEQAIPIGLLVAANWLHRHAARYVLVTAYSCSGRSDRLARCQVLQIPRDASEFVKSAASSSGRRPDFAWLTLT